MSNILNLNEEIDFKDITISNPTLISGNNYFSKINKGSISKNLYIQFPKCSLKKIHYKKILQKIHANLYSIVAKKILLNFLKI